MWLMALVALVASSEKLNQRVGADFEVEVTAMRNPPRPEDGDRWGDAKVNGAAVMFLDTRVIPPAKDVDGGSNRHVYRFKAVKKGKATITIENKGKDPHVVVVTVE